MYVDPELKSRIAYLFEHKKDSMAEGLGIEFLHIEPQKLVASMPVNEKTRQPQGILHGGASAALAETLASVGGWMNIDPEENMVVGMELSINHLRPVKSGKVTGTSLPTHIGKKTQLWDIRIENDERKLVAVSRCLLAVLPNSKE